MARALTRGARDDRVSVGRFTVYVVPRSTRTGPDGSYAELPRLRVRSPATDGRANDEAERLLTELIGVRVRLVAGHRSRQKTFEADLRPAALAAKLREAFSPASGGAD